MRGFAPFYITVAALVSLTAVVGPYSTVLVPKWIMDMLMKESSFVGILLVIGSMPTVNLLRITVLSLFEERYKPLWQWKVERGMNALLMEKSEFIAMKQYDNPEFRDVYDRAIVYANSAIRTFLNAISNLTDRFLYLISVVTIMTSMDPFLICFSLCCVCVLFSSRLKYLIIHTGRM